MSCANYSTSRCYFAYSFQMCACSPDACGLTALVFRRWSCWSPGACWCTARALLPWQKMRNRLPGPSRRFPSFSFSTRWGPWQLSPGDPVGHGNVSVVMNPELREGIRHAKLLKQILWRSGRFFQWKPFQMVLEHLEFSHPDPGFPGLYSYWPEMC